MNPLIPTLPIQKNKNGLLLFLIFFLLGFNTLHAQVQNNGSVYVGSGGSIYVKSGAFIFGTGSTTKTDRTASTFGKIIFGASAIHTGATAGTTLIV